MKHNIKRDFMNLPENQRRAIFAPGHVVFENSIQRPVSRKIETTKYQNIPRPSVSKYFRIIPHGLPNKVGPENSELCSHCVDKAHLNFGSNARGLTSDEE